MRAVPRRALDRDVERIRGRLARAGASADGAGRERRPVVKAEDDVRLAVREHVVVEHRLGTPQRLLRRLEDEHHAAGQRRAHLRHHACNAAHDRRVRVVAARVHLARDLRRVVEARGLAHRQRVHVGANRHRRPGLAAFEHGHDAGAADACTERNAARGEERLHALRGLALLERELGVRVDGAAQCDHVVHPAVGGSVDHGQD